MTRKKQTKVRSRRPTNLRGKGDYDAGISSITDPIKRVESKIDHLERSINKKATAKGAASTIGRTLGNFFNQGDLGALAGESMAKLFGHGDFQVVSNSLINPSTSSTQVPKFTNHGKRGTRIIEREYLCDLKTGPMDGGSTAFTNIVFPINPTNTKTFPWLSTIAHLYDQWEPNGIVFEFVSTSSEFNGTSQALGAVIMSTDYDMFDQPYKDKREAENADYACSTKPALSLMHGIECDPKERPTPILYTSTPTDEKRLSYLGNHQISTVGCSVSDVTLGEIWISYDITFYKKQIVDTVTTFPHFCGSGYSLTTAVPQYRFDNLGDVGTPVISKDITIVNTLGQSKITFGENVYDGVYLINYWLYYVPGLEPVGLNVSELYNMELLSYSDSGALAQRQSQQRTPNVPTTELTFVNQQYLVRILGPNAYIPSAPTTYTEHNIRFTLNVIKVPENFWIGPLQ